MSDEENKKIHIEGQAATLADLAGLSLDEFKEKRGESLPRGHFLFEVSAEGEEVPHLIIMGEGEKAVGGALFVFKVLEAIAVNDPDFTGNPDELIGKSHYERFRIADADGLGYLKAFLKDIGAANGGKPLKELLTDCAGLRFQAPIGKRKSKDDADVTYTNIVRGNKIKPVAPAAVSDVARQVA